MAEAAVVLLEDKLPPLARELAMGIYPVDEILERYGVTSGEFDKITAMPRFQALLDSVTVEWGSTLNTRERVKFKALAGLEDSLAAMFAAAKDSRETLASRVEALKLARMLGGLADRETGEGVGVGEKFTLTINVGDTKTEVGGKLVDITPGPQNLRPGGGGVGNEMGVVESGFTIVTDRVAGAAPQFDLRYSAANNDLSMGYRGDEDG